MLRIKDIKLLKITKVKPWAIYFNYDGERYLLHGCGDGGEYGATLFRKSTDKQGRYELYSIASKFECTELISDKYLGKYKKGTPYSHMDKMRFVRIMTYNKFFWGCCDYDAELARNKIHKINEENEVLNKIIRKNNEAKNRILQFKRRNRIIR